MENVGSRAFQVMNISRKPSHIKIILHDLFRLNNEIRSDKNHLKAAMEWLCRAQDITGCGGVSASYNFSKGWEPAYPEVTGYIIPTFLQYASLNSDSSYTERSIKMGDWEIEIQLLSGGVRARSDISQGPLVFDTGQVILGWISLYKKTKLDRFLDSAVKAADWLISIQDNDGKWSKHAHEGIPHVYHTRVACSLLEVYRFTNAEKYKNAAKKNIVWALACTKENGWFSQMGFTINETPLTHTIAYTLRGLMESSLYLAKETKQKILSIVQKASENIMRTYGLMGEKSDPRSMPMYLPATLNEKWKSKDNYSCLTGNAQLSIIWLKLYNINNDARFLKAALELIDQVKTTQSLDCKNLNIRGGIAGSYPIWGRYGRFTYISWSSKFFADSIMLQESIKQKLEEKKK
jgi:hypothetical protein